MADNVTITEGTSKAIAADDVSSVWYQRIKLDKGVDGSADPFTGTIDAVSVLAAGTISEVGTVTGVGVLADGTVAISSFNADLPGGTVDVVVAGTITRVQGGTVGKIDTLGTIEGTIENIGTVHNIGTLGTILGTIENIGTIHNLGTVAVLNAGSVVVTDGTIGDLDTIGTVGILTTGTIAEIGTVTGVGVLAAGTIGKVGTVTGVGVLAAGSVVTTAGTITTQLAGTQELLGTVNKVGTVDIITSGTIGEVGTITGIGVLGAGTVITGGGTVQIDPKSPTYLTTYGTLLTGAGQTWATISAASGAGTYHYIQGVSAVVHSGTVDCFIGIGSALVGTGVLARGSFPEGGGIARNYTSALRSSGTNSEIICEIGGAGTVTFTCDFWRGT